MFQQINHHYPTSINSVLKSFRHPHGRQVIDKHYGISMDTLYRVAIFDLMSIAVNYYRHIDQMRDIRPYVHTYIRGKLVWTS